jgi:hypothetical protein
MHKINCTHIISKENDASLKKTAENLLQIQGLLEIQRKLSAIKSLAWSHITWGLTGWSDKGDDIWQYITNQGSIPPK